MLKQQKPVIYPADKTSPWFDDEVAKITNWEAKNSGGANFATHRLFTDSEHRMEFVGSNIGVVFPLIFIAIGIGLYYVAIFNSRSTADMLFTFFLGFPFLGVGGLLFASQAKPIVFDLQKNYAWIGFKPPVEPNNETSCSIGKIHAIQLIKKWIKGSKGSYYSYELNLVLKGGERINMVNHGDRQQIQKDAQVLANFLGVPVWNNIS